MDDVETLVLTFYEFAEKQRLDMLNAGGMSHADEHSDDHASNAGAAKKNGNGGKAPVNEERKAALSNSNINDGEKDNIDDETLVIDNDDIVSVLKDFHKKREEKANNGDLVGNPRMKKRSNFESEEQKKERVKREERIFWEKMTTVLDDKKLSTWKALDKALTKYYALLVDRQNLIEETGLLNQQNEELKTLLNQYLQDGVNHELHVPPTQVIRLDI